MINRSSKYEVSTVFTDLRQMALKASPTDIGIKCVGEELAVWGLLMETGYPKAIATLVALADGSVSLYFSNGGGIIGAGQNTNPREASATLLQNAPKFLEFMQLTTGFPLPLNRPEYIGGCLV